MARAGRTHDLVPAHPLATRLALTRGLAEAGMAAEARVATGRWLRVRPTLSTRTVAVTADPRAQLKLPLPVSTLGLRNRRALEPRTLGDGALVRRVLAAAADRDHGLDGLLLADDGDFAHAGHPCLAYLRRRLPDGLGGSRIVPVAALLAETGGELVIENLAGPEPVPAYFRRYLDLVFGIAVRLFVRYGIALESHQQNAAVTVPVEPPAAAGGPGPGLRLLVKDFDGALINHGRLAAALGGAAPEPGGFGDPPELRAVLAGVPLPAKANLRVRWARDADRDAGYVTVPNPMRQLEPCQLGSYEREPRQLELAQLEPA